MTEFQPDRGFDPSEQSTSAHRTRGQGLLTIFGLCFSVILVATLGALVSDGSNDPWYETLIKPPLNPPGFVFGLVWPVLYVLMAVSAVIVLNNARRMAWAGTSFAFFFLQLALNLSWSVLFFFFHEPVWALIVIVTLVFAVANMMGAFYRHSRFAASLQLPYLVWLCFATYLNGAIVWLNGFTLT